MDDLIKEYNGKRDRTILPNKGLRKETTLFNKKIKIGYDGDSPIYLTLEIKEIDLSTQAIYNGDGDLLYIGNKKETINHTKITTYKTISICGDSKNMGGQIYDSLIGTDDITIRNIKKVKEIIKLWKRWHLNDMQPNCEHQESFNCNGDNFKELAAEQTKKCPKKYRYGSKWLIEIVPQNEIDLLQKIFTEGL